MECKLIMHQSSLYPFMHLLQSIMHQLKLSSYPIFKECINPECWRVRNCCFAERGMKWERGNLFSWPIKIFISYRLRNNPISHSLLLIFPSSPQDPLRENLSNSSGCPRPRLGEIKTNFCLLCLSFICQKDLCLEKGIYNAGQRRSKTISLDNNCSLFLSLLSSSSDWPLKVMNFQYSMAIFMTKIEATLLHVLQISRARSKETKYTNHFMFYSNFFSVIFCCIPNFTLKMHICQNQ